MIIGNGVDLFNCERLRHIISERGERFLHRIFTKTEIDALKNKFQAFDFFNDIFYNHSFSHNDDAFLENDLNYRKFLTSVGKTFAAKEAFAKALGTGFRSGISFHCFEIIRNDLGRPQGYVFGKALDHLQTQFSSTTHFRFHVSLTDDWPYVQAFIIIEGH